MSGRGRILIMDDEETVSIMMSKILEKFGYESDQAADGMETIDKYVRAMKNDCPYDLVILDLTVKGGMGGLECIHELKEIDPSVKAIVSSGYSSDPVLANYEEYGFDGIITKPVDIKELGRTLRDVMEND